MPRDEILRAPRRRPRRGCCRRPAARPTRRSGATRPWGWVYIALHGHYLDHLGGHRAVDRRAPRSARSMATRSSPTRAPLDHAEFVAQDAAIAADFDRLIRPLPPDAPGRRRDVTPGWTLARPRRATSPTGPRRASGRSRSFAAARPLAVPTRTKGIDAWNERMVAPLPGRSGDRGRRSSATTRTRAALLAARRVRLSDRTTCARPTAGAGPYDCLHGHVRKHLAMLGPWCAAPDLADGRDRRADADRPPTTPSPGPDDRGDRRGRRAARVPAPPARPGRRLHGRGRRRAPAVHARRCAAATRPS